MATIRQVGLGGGVSGAQAFSVTDRLLALLTSRLAHTSGTVDVNFQTGAAAPGNISIDQAVAAISRGATWVDYGQWPWGQARPGVSFASPGGFGAFLYHARVALGQPGGFAVTSINPGAFAEGFAGSLTFGLVPSYQHRNDPFDFDLQNWSWTVNLARYRGGGRYPYGYGLPTTTPPTADRVIPMPGAAIGVVSPANPPQTIYVYSAFALRIGRGWYFQAQPNISPDLYAEFIGDTLGAPLPGRLNMPVAIAGGKAEAPAVGGVNVPSVTLRLTNPYTSGAYVKLLQLHLESLGFGSLLGPTGADGVFGPDTQSAVIAFERANAGARAPNGGKIVVDGIVGPAAWSLLLAGSPRGASAQPQAPQAPTTRAPVGGEATKGGGGTPTRQVPSAAGVWVKGEPYAIVGGKDVKAPINHTPLKTLQKSGGYEVVNGYKVHFPHMPSSGTSTTTNLGFFTKIVDEISSATGLPATDVEFITIGGGIAALLLLAGK